MRTGTLFIALVCLAGFVWLWANMDSDSVVTKAIVVGVLGLAWSGIVFVGAGIVAAVLGAAGIISGRTKE